MRTIIFFICLILVGSTILTAVNRPERDRIKELETKQKTLDKKIECLIGMQWKQDENAIKIYNGMEPDWQGRQYPEVPECEGIL